MQKNKLYYVAFIVHLVKRCTVLPPNIDTTEIFPSRRVWLHPKHSHPQYSAYPLTLIVISLLHVVILSGSDLVKLPSVYMAAGANVSSSQTRCCSNLDGSKKTPQ